MADFHYDQAEGLRRLLGRGHLRVIALAAGCTGVGQTSAAINIAAALAARGRQVLVIDENAAPANVSARLGLRARFELQNVIRQECSMEDALLEEPGGVTVLPAAAASRDLPGLRRPERERLIRSLGRLDERFDVVLVDTRCSNNGPGLLSAAAQDTIIVSSAATRAITASYALIKRMHAGHRECRFHLLLNRVAVERNADVIFDNLQRVARQHLQTPLECLGCVPKDDNLREAEQECQPVMKVFPSSASAAGFRRIAEAIAGWPPTGRQRNGVENFMQRLFASNHFTLANAGV
jgi:flagellar biosynthesis protein FlhG